MDRGLKKPFLLILLIASIGLSCIPPKNEVAINPAILFTSGSEFLRDASSLALKGTVEIEGPEGMDSGDFTAFLTDSDSVFFLIEGPFNVDMFRLLVRGDETWFKSRDMEDWEYLHSSDRLSIDEYGIDNLIPSETGAYLFPQFYLSLNGQTSRGWNMKSRNEGSSFELLGSGNRRSFVLLKNDTNVKASYEHLKKIEDGYYPSRIRIFDTSEDWELKMQIRKIVINPNVPASVWIL